jgi:hypothetical protein
MSSQAHLSRTALLYMGTADGMLVLRYDGAAGVEVAGRGLEGSAVRGIATHPRRPGEAWVGAGLRGHGLHRTQDGGRSYRPAGFGDVWVWDVAWDQADPDVVWVGTEPPMVHVSRDGGATFTPCAAIDRLPSRGGWSFFHPPFYAGHVHGIAIHPDRPERVFAGVEHGAFVFTHDSGTTWGEALVGHDLHRVAVDPADPDRVLAGTGGGLYESRDAGLTWASRAVLAGYVHGIRFDPHRPGRAYAYVVGRGPLHVSEDAGRTWRPLAPTLPSGRQSDTLCPHPAVPDLLFYTGDPTEDRSRLYVSDDAGRGWRELADGLPKAWRMQAVPIT